MTDSELSGRGGVLDHLLRRDRVLVVAGLVVITGAAWAYIVQLERQMRAMDVAMDMGMVMPRMEPWSATELAMLVIMWSVMMVAMMLPSATRMILLFSSVQRRRYERSEPHVPTWFFVSGYVVVWVIFSGAAAFLQWGLHEAALLSSSMVGTSPVLGGGLLVAAGAYQFTPLKDACLSSCRSPLFFLSTQWRDGLAGAFRMGTRHGMYCVGCCWVLMALLFVAGVMNLLWVAGIAAFVLIEKSVGRGEWLSRAAGTALLLAGVFVWASASW